MPRNVTVTFGDGSTHVYQNAPDTLTPQDVATRAASDFGGKAVTNIDGGNSNSTINPPSVAPPAPSLADQISSGIKSAASVVMGAAGEVGDTLKYAGNSAVDGMKSALHAITPLAQSGETADGVPAAAGLAPAPPPPTGSKLDAVPQQTGPLHIPADQPYELLDSEKSPARVAAERQAAAAPQAVGVDQDVARHRAWDTSTQNPLQAGYNVAAGHAGNTMANLTSALGEATGSVDLRDQGRRFHAAADLRINRAMQGNEDSDTVKTVAGIFGLAPLLAGSGPGIAAMVTQAGVDGYGDARQAGDSPAEAVGRGTAMALANYVGMRVQVPGIAKALSTAVSKAPAGEAIAALGHALTTNVGGMEATTALSDLYDKMAPGGLRPNMTATDMVNDIAATAKSAALLTLAVPGVPLGAAHLYGAAHALAHGNADAAARDLGRSAPPAGGDTAAPAPPPGAPGALPIGIDTLHDSIDETAGKIGLSPKAAAALRDAAAKQDPQDAPGFIARAFHRFEANGLTKRAGAPGAFRDILNQRLADQQPDEPAAPAPAAGPSVADQLTAIRPLDAPAPATDAVPEPAAAEPAPITPTAMAQANDIAGAAHEAATSPFNDTPEPTDAQKAVGNYKVGKVQMHGLDISIENPQGSTRSGVDPDGKPWSNEMAAHYGYIRGTHASDGDHVDTFIGPNPESKTAYVIDQVDPSTGKFDEPKTILGADSEQQARELYAANYADGWNGLGAITPLPMDAFKSWVRDGVKSKPLGDITQWKATDERAQPDVAKPAEVAPGAGDGGGGPAVAGGGDSRPDAAVEGGRTVGGDAVAPAGGAGAADAVGGGSGADKALTGPAGPAPRLLGKSVTDYETPALQKIAGMQASSERARDVANAEIARRAAPGEPAEITALRKSASADGSTATKPLDHGELSIPGRTNGINAELDHYKAAKATEKRMAAKTVAAQSRADKSEAKALLAEHHDSLVAHVLAEAKGRTTAKEVEHTLDQWAKWEPKKLIGLVQTYLKKTADQTPILKRGEVTKSAGVDPVALRSEVARIRAGWSDSPELHVVDDVNGLPREIQDSLRSMGAEGKTRALLMPGRGSDKGDVYLIANRLPNAQKAQEALFHEVLGHYGIRKVLGSDAVYSAEMYKLRQANPALASEAEAWYQHHGRGAIADRMSRGLSQEAAMKVVRALSTEEALADRAGKGEPIRGLQKLMAKIQQWLRSVGMHSVADHLEKMTEAETAALLAKARSTVESEGLVAHSGDEGAPALMSADDDPEHKALQTITAHDDMFALPKSDKKTIKDIAAENDPAIKFVRETKISSLETMYRLQMADGAPAFITVRKSNKYGPSVYGFRDHQDGLEATTERPGSNPEDVDPNKEDVYIDVSHLKSGSDGSTVYNIAATFAHNTGRVFIGDPAGVSDMAMRRRPQHMLSSALKFGTTEHLAPHPDQVSGRGGVPPLDWVYGDHVGNVRRLVDHAVKSIENDFPASKDIIYDPATAKFRDAATGAEASLAGIGELLPRGTGGVEGRSVAGSRTIARAAVWRALLRGEGGKGEGAGQRNDLLARLGEWAPQLSHPDMASRIFLSQHDGSDAAGDRVAEGGRGSDERVREDVLRAPEGGASGGDGGPAPLLSQHAAEDDAVAPDAPKSRVAEALTKVREAGAKISDNAKAIRDDALLKVVPISLGNPETRTIAKDFANADRLARWQWGKFDEVLKKNYDDAQRKEMWEAADEENVLRQQDIKPSDSQGLNRLTPDQRATMDSLHNYGEQLLQRAKDVGMFQGEGLPYWTPRMAVMIGDTGEYQRPKGAGAETGAAVGRNVVTSASSLKERKHLTAADTEAAMKGKLGEGAQLVRDIRTMPLAMARLERAIAGRDLVNNIKAMGQRAGLETVSSTEQPGFFTVAHPAFKTWQVTSGEDGSKTWEAKPLYVNKAFQGPLKAVMSETPGPIYSALMALKGKSMGLIMYSPLIHNAVEWGRALPAMPGKVATFQIYFEGNRIKNDPVQMRQAIKDGLVPIGRRGGIQDITGIMEDPSLKPGRSWTAKLLGAAIGVVEPVAKPTMRVAGKATGLVAVPTGAAVRGVGAAVRAVGAERLGGVIGKTGEALGKTGQFVDNFGTEEGTKKNIDAAGDFWHNTLLWDRVGDLQAGLYGALREKEIAKGTDPAAAGKLAAHFANRFAGALPNESMSAGARKIANILMFSRTFTLGNMGLMKDMVSGLPRDIQAQIRASSGELAAAAATSRARRIAIASFIVDIGLMYVGNSVMQDTIKKLRGQKSWGEIGQGYLDRLHKLLQRTGDHPLETLSNPFDAANSLSSTSENEPGKEDRIRVGTQNDGTAIYARLPTGKVGEDFKNWITKPLITAKAKESQLVRPLQQVWSNDNGIGQRIYDPDAKGIGGVLTNAGRIAKLFATQMVPADAIQGALDWKNGKASDVDKLKVVGPLAGLTFSKGAPGGPEIGAMYDADRKFLGAKMDVMPDVKKAIKDGDDEKAIALMQGIKMTGPEINSVLRRLEVPASRMSSGAFRNFSHHASDEDMQRMMDLLQGEQAAKASAAPASAP